MQTMSPRGRVLADLLAQVQQAYRQLHGMSRVQAYSLYGALVCAQAERYGYAAVMAGVRVSS